MTDEQELQTARNVSIAELLGLHRVNRRQQIRCPIHNDRTPSFTLFPDNSFHCFGCSAHGNNAIDFVMVLLNVDFKQAVRELQSHVAIHR